MRIGFVADLHGNWPATQAVAEDIKRRHLDALYALGDLVGKGPSSAKTADWAFDNCQVLLKGNWDSGIGERQFAADDYYWNQLGEARMQRLAALPFEAELTLSGRRFRLFHGRPVSALMVAQTPSEEIKPFYYKNDTTYQGLIFADSHRPFLRVLEPGYYINCGSVGNSLGVPQAHYLIVECGDSLKSPLDFTFVSLPYDTEQAVQDALADNAMPHRDAYIKEITTGQYSR